MKATLIGIVAEITAIAGAYAIYAYWQRFSLYAVFYLPIDNRLIVPAIIRFGSPATYRGAHLFAEVLLILVNSLKWAGCVLLFQRHKKTLGGIIAGVLAAMIVISVSLKDMPF